MSLKGWKLTTKGQALYAKINAGLTTLTVTKMALGEGVPVGTNINDLDFKVVDVPVSYSLVEKNVTLVEGTLDTATLENTLQVTEWGVYAQDPDDGEILLALNLYTDPYIIDPIEVPSIKTMRMLLVTDIVPNDVFASKNDLLDIYNQINEIRLSAGTSSLEYSQVTKLNAEANKQLIIPVETLSTFCYPPIEVLKLYGTAEDDEPNIYTACEFLNTDKNHFDANDEVVFDGTMYLRSTRNIPMSDLVEVSDGYLSYSDEIDISNYYHEEDSVDEVVKII